MGVLAILIIAAVVFLVIFKRRKAPTLDQYIQERLKKGDSKEEIEKELLNDLNNNGQIFSEFRSAIKSTANGSTKRVRDIGYFNEVTLDRDYRWSAILLEDTCEDCKKRHGQVKTWSEWEAEGLPRTGATRCLDDCRCVLIPAKFRDQQTLYVTNWI